VHRSVLAVAELPEGPVGQVCRPVFQVEVVYCIVDRAELAHFPIL
jgi:hypothetical protein